mmetsp:Transcript_34341/g.80371  ORF Transcript_34341/g.80371 Transcript_34341/m.80371 type:complete len:207 (-) Transcript_34341:32-652(-)
MVSKQMLQRKCSSNFTAASSTQRFCAMAGEASCLSSEALLAGFCKLLPLLAAVLVLPPELAPEELQLASSCCFIAGLGGSSSGAGGLANLQPLACAEFWCGGGGGGGGLILESWVSNVPARTPEQDHKPAGGGCAMPRGSTPLTSACEPGCHSEAHHGASRCFLLDGGRMPIMPALLRVVRSVSCCKRGCLEHLMGVGSNYHSTDL